MISAEAKEAMYSKLNWSEEDDKMLDSIIEEVRYIGDFPDYPSKEEDELYDECSAKVKWLKSLKERVQPNGSCQDITALGRCYIEGERKVKDTTVIYHESGLKALEKSLEKGCTEGEQKHCGT